MTSTVMRTAASTTADLLDLGEQATAAVGLVMVGWLRSALGGPGTAESTLGSVTVDGGDGSAPLRVLRARDRSAAGSVGLPSPRGAPRDRGQERAR